MLRVYRRSEAQRTIYLSTRMSLVMLGVARGAGAGKVETCAGEADHRLVTRHHFLPTVGSFV